jgi:hypothetical protein
VEPNLMAALRGPVLPGSSTDDPPTPVPVTGENVIAAGSSIVKVG